jgi:hypothetical protein
MRLGEARSACKQVAATDGRPAITRSRAGIDGARPPRPAEPRPMCAPRWQPHKRLRWSAACTSTLSGAVCAGSNPAEGAARYLLIEYIVEIQPMPDRTNEKCLVTGLSPAAHPNGRRPPGKITRELREKPGTTTAPRRQCPASCSLPIQTNNGRQERVLTGNGGPAMLQQMPAESSSIPLLVTDYRSALAPHPAL